MAKKDLNEPLEFEELVPIVEALIFAAEEPVSIDRLRQVVSEISGTRPAKKKQFEKVIEFLNSEYAKTVRSFQIQNWAGGFRLATLPEYAPFIRNLLQTSKRKLSRSLVETLAILSYRQPATKPEVDFIRGVDSDYALRRLLELELAEIIGRRDSPGRPLLYGTTELFLEKFGLPDLQSLPNLREIEELLADPDFDKERAQLLMSQSIEHPMESDPVDPLEMASTSTDGTHTNGQPS